MWSTIALLALGAAIVVVWQKHVDARELARRLAARLCQQQGVQLLDQTVVLRGVRLARRGGTVAVARSYSFDFSRDGIDRRRGVLTLVGAQLDAALMPLD